MNVSASIDIAAPPDQVWEVVRETGSVSEWVPAIESSRLEGDIRHAVFAGGGGNARERIVEVDDAQRAYVYEYLDGPLALQQYRSRLAVTADAGGTHVSWDSELSAADAEEEATLADAIAGIYRDALAELARQITGRSG
jgi:carbon monoxide dehydrogenase subunit G